MHSFARAALWRHYDGRVPIVSEASETRAAQRFCEQSRHLPPPTRKVGGGRSPNHRQRPRATMPTAEPSQIKPNAAGGGLLHFLISPAADDLDDRVRERSIHIRGNFQPVARPGFADGETCSDDAGRLTHSATRAVVELPVRAIGNSDRVCSQHFRPRRRTVRLNSLEHRCHRPVGKEARGGGGAGETRPT